MAELITHVPCGVTVNGAFCGGYRSGRHEESHATAVACGQNHACSGLTETEASAQNRKIEVARFPWAASGRAMTMDRPEGVTKLIIDPETERVLGMGIAGAGAGELIAEGVLAVEMAALATDVKLSIHAHPTLSETVMESAEVFFGQSTHVYRPKRPQK